MQITFDSEGRPVRTPLRKEYKEGDEWSPVVDPVEVLEVKGSVISDQPPPTQNGRPAIQDLVVQDIQERKQVGIERYGTPLQGFNGRDGLVDLYQELLDAVQYVRQLIYERDTPMKLESEETDTITSDARERSREDGQGSPG